MDIRLISCMKGIFQRKQAKPSKALKELRDRCCDLEEQVGALKAELEAFKAQSRFFVQRVGVVRYNPFREQGGDQSFSAALLNENNDGIVITSLFGSGENRVYGKPVEQGSSTYPLTEEEQQAIEQACSYAGDKRKN